jgi:hypothetical protein
LGFLQFFLIFNPLHQLSNKTEVHNCHPTEISTVIPLKSRYY